MRLRGLGSLKEEKGMLKNGEYFNIRKTQNGTNKKTNWELKNSQRDPIPWWHYWVIAERVV